MLEKINLSKINIFIFVLMFFSKSITDALFVQYNINSPLTYIKYVLLAVSFMLSILILYKKNIRSFNLFNETKSIIIMCISLMLISFFYSLSSMKFSFSSIYEVLTILVPCIYVFVFFNSLEHNDMYWCFLWVLLISILSYVFFEVGIENFTISNLKSISWDDSYSIFESHYTAALSFELALFFIIDDRKKIVTIISIVFCLFTFKRILILGIIIAIIFKIIQKVFRFNFKSKKYSYLFFALSFTFLTIIYYYILRNNLLNLDFSALNKITMSRYSFFQRLYNSDYMSYGLSSSTEFLEKNIEMDLIRYLFEIGPIGLAIFCVGMFKFSNRNSSGQMIMICNFLVLLTSHTLLEVFTWILIFIIIFSTDRIGAKKYE